MRPTSHVLSMASRFSPRSHTRVDSKSRAMRKPTKLRIRSMSSSMANSMMKQRLRPTKHTRSTKKPSSAYGRFESCDLPQTTTPQAPCSPLKIRGIAKPKSRSRGELFSMTLNQNEMIRLEDRNVCAASRSFPMDGPRRDLQLPRKEWPRKGRL
jgi:hypothetical protein